jgi:protein-disulfide isomerase
MLKEKEIRIVLILDMTCPHCNKPVNLVVTKKGAKDLLKTIKQEWKNRVQIEMELRKPEDGTTKE